jgi:hypothetical protein
MQKTLTKVFSTLPYLPLTFFLIYARINNFANSAWYGAFLLGGIVALIQFVLLVSMHMHMNRFILAINLFLCIGAIAFLFNISWLLYMYSKLKATALFFSLLMVGIVTTFYTKRGFIDRQKADAKTIRISSLILLAGTFIALLVSYFFNGNFIYSGLLPFLGVKFLQTFLIKKFHA